MKITRPPYAYDLDNEKVTELPEKILISSLTGS